jgi:hypothetical protein
MGLRHDTPLLRRIAGFLAVLCLLAGIAANLHHAHHLYPAAGGSQAALVAPDSDCLLCRYEAQLVSPAVVPALGAPPVLQAIPLSEPLLPTPSPVAAYPGFVSSPRSPPRA